MVHRPICVYDANGLYPAQLRDFLMRLALGDVVRAHWTEQIHTEWMRNVEADYPDITWEDLQRVRTQMDKALPSALVGGHEDRIDALFLPDPSDRHVLAAAILVGAHHILTFNVRDFSARTLDTWDMAATEPDALLRDRFDQVPDQVIDVARTHRASLTRPSKTPDEYIRLLQVCGLEETARRLAPYVNRIEARSPAPLSARVVDDSDDRNDEDA